MKSSLFSPSTCIAISQACRLISKALAAYTSSSRVATLFFFISERKILGPAPRKLKRELGATLRPPIKNPKILLSRLSPVNERPCFSLMASRPQKVEIVSNYPLMLEYYSIWRFPAPHFRKDFPEEDIAAIP